MVNTEGSVGEESAQEDMDVMLQHCVDQGLELEFVSNAIGSHWEVLSSTAQ